MSCITELSHPSEQPMPSDGLLLANMRQGEESAFEMIFHRYYARLYRLLYNVVINHEEAEDLVQETFFTLYQQPPTLTANSTLSAWLYRVALNRGYNLLRHNRRMQHRAAASASHTTDGTIEGIEGNNNDNDPYLVLVRAEERARVRAILALLPERQSKLLLLRYAGVSYADIATILSIARGSVGTLLARGVSTPVLLPPFSCKKTFVLTNICSCF